MSKASERVDREIVHDLKERRRERLYAAYEEAVGDPAYVAEMAALTLEFDCAVGDGLD